MATCTYVVVIAEREADGVVDGVVPGVRVPAVPHRLHLQEEGRPQHLWRALLDALRHEPERPLPAQAASSTLTEVSVQVSLESSVKIKECRFTTILEWLDFVATATQSLFIHV